MQFYQDRTDKKSYGVRERKIYIFHLRSGRNVVWAARLGTNPKRCELRLFFAGIRQAIRRWKALDLGSLDMQFQQDWPKDEKITALLNFCWKTKILLD